MTTMDSSTSAAVLCTPLVDNPLRSPRVKRMHSGLQQRLTMESSFEQHVSKCNPQAKSPLWNTLPAELRYMIFEFATAQYEDMPGAYPEHEDRCRPDHRAPLKSCTNILQTCRRAWLEAHAWPMRQATHLFWVDHGWPLTKHGRKVRRWWFTFGMKLTRLNLQNLRHIHFMLPLHDLHAICDPGSSAPKIVRILKPKIFQITNRACDWPRFNWGTGGWGDDAHKVAIRRNIILILNACVGNVTTFRLALEVLDKDGAWEGQAPFFDSIRSLRSEDATVQKLRSDIPYGSYLRVVDEPRSWRRQHRPKPDYRSGIVDPDAADIKYRILELEWVHSQDVAGPSIKSDNADSPQLNPTNAGPGDDQSLIDLGTLLCRQDRLRQSAHQRARGFEAQCRRAFSKQRIAMEVGDEVRRLRGQVSLLHIVEE